MFAGANTLQSLTSKCVLHWAHPQCRAQVPRIHSCAALRIDQTYSPSQFRRAGYTTQKPQYSRTVHCDELIAEIVLTQISISERSYFNNKRNKTTEVLRVRIQCQQGGSSCGEHPNQVRSTRNVTRGLPASQ